MLEPILLAIVAFISTNIDDAFVLLALFADRTLGARNVVIGQYLGMAVLTFIAAAFALLAYAVPGQYVGLTGLLPIVIGLARLWTLWKDNASSEVKIKPPAGVGGLSATFSVALITIANGSDNIAIYIPLFAKSSVANMCVTGGVFAALVAVWLVAAFCLINHRRLGVWVRRWGHRVTPFVLIALGSYILIRAGVFGASH